jgi:N utilization substance protein A
MNDELFDALVILEKEKNIKSEVLLEAIAKSLEQACRNNFNRPELDNIVVDLNQEKRSFGIFLAKEVVETVEDKLKQISLADARMINSKYEVGDVVNVDINSRAFGRIAVQNAKNVILQQIREAERKSLFADYYDKENKVVTGVVQRYVNRNVAINLGKVDAILSESEMIKGETFYPNQRVKVYVLRVDNAPKGPRIVVSRKHPNLVRCLFEQEVAEVADGTVEIKAIAREAGSRSKMAVWSNIPNVDAVGACVGQNGNRVAAVVDELDGEKIDIVSWDENPAYFIENALSPAKVITVIVDPDERTARVVVPDYQLSLAIGKEGQNARLTARLTGYKIDIKSETQAIESGELQEFQDEYYDYEDEYDENGEPYPDEYYEDYPEDEYYEADPGEDPETDPVLE